jgi:hypothetical protein
MSQTVDVVDATQKESETRKYGVYQNEIYFKGTVMPTRDVPRYG